jgi:hypothetical protein
MPDALQKFDAFSLRRQNLPNQILHMDFVLRIDADDMLSFAVVQHFLGGPLMLQNRKIGFGGVGTTRRPFADTVPERFMARLAVEDGKPYTQILSQGTENGALFQLQKCCINDSAKAGRQTDSGCVCQMIVGIRADRLTVNSARQFGAT